MVAEPGRPATRTFGILLLFYHLVAMGERHHEATVPWWDGDLATLDVYTEKAYYYIDGTEKHKRYTCGPRLAAKLKGPARTVVEGRRREWLSRPDGGERLLTKLHRRLQRPAVPDLGKYLEDYVVNLRRRKGEAMSGWSLRAGETYQKLRRAMARVTRPAATTKNELREEGADDRQRAPPEIVNGFRPSNRTVAQGTWEDWETSNWGQSTWADWRPWTGSQAESEEVQCSGPWGATSFEEDDSDDNDVENDLPEILPSVIRGWLLLQRSGLDAQERAAVLAASRNSLEVMDVEAALRAQWGDNDLTHRDGKKGPGEKRHHGAFFGEDAATWEEADAKAYYGDGDWDDEYLEEPEASDNGVTHVPEDFTQEELKSFLSAQEQEAEAMMAIGTAQRTLREARQQLATNRLRRGNFFPKGQGPQARPDGKYGTKGAGKGKGYDLRPGKGPSYEKPPVKCFRCQGPHYASACPDKADSRTDANKTNVAAFCMGARFENSFIGGAEKSEDMPGIFLAQHYVDKGMGVIDCGATEAIGGVDALESLARRLSQQDGRQPDVDTKDRPWFTFGNGARQQVMSRVAFGVNAADKEGNFKCYSLEAKGVPILVSIAALSSLGAIIDFKRNLAVFTELDATAVIKLEKAESGHLLLDLASDLLKNQVGTLSEKSALGRLQSWCGGVSAPDRPSE